MKKTGYQRRLAKATGYSPAYVSLILSGGRTISIYTTAETFARATNTQPELWLKGRPGDLRKAARDAYGNGGGR